MLYNRAAACLVVLGCAAGVQAQALEANEPEFIAAAMKLASKPDRQSMRGGPGTASPGQFTCVATSLHDLIARAWDLKSFELVGSPAWDNTLFDITAKIPPEATKDEFKRMLRKLLTERVSLVVHRESREQQAYNLTVDKNGARLVVAESGKSESQGKPADARFVRGADGRPQLLPGRPVALGSIGAGGVRLMARMQDHTGPSKHIGGISGSPRSG